jgi:RNA polymerase sigma-70 factor (ECF subfamily)
MDTDPESSHQTDEALASAARTDARQFAYLVARYEAPLARYVRRLGVENAEDREDILQDVFVKIYENLNGFDPSLPFSSWAYRITHNETMSFFRRRNARPRSVEVPDEVLERIASEYDIGADAAAREHADVVRACIAALPPAYADVLVLRFFEEKTYEEISDILRLPKGTVAVRLRRAKDRLAACLTARGYHHTI